LLEALELFQAEGRLAKSNIALVTPVMQNVRGDLEFSGRPLRLCDWVFREDGFDVLQSRIRCGFRRFLPFHPSWFARPPSGSSCRPTCSKMAILTAVFSKSEDTASKFPRCWLLESGNMGSFCTTYRPEPRAALSALRVGGDAGNFDGYFLQGQPAVGIKAVFDFAEVGTFR
jgi:hypothetical protein